MTPSFLERGAKINRYIYQHARGPCQEQWQILELSILPYKFPENVVYMLWYKITKVSQLKQYNNAQKIVIFQSRTYNMSSNPGFLPRIVYLMNGVFTFWDSQTPKTFEFGAEET